MALPTDSLTNIIMLVNESVTTSSHGICWQLIKSANSGASWIKGAFWQNFQARSYVWSMSIPYLIHT